MFYFKPEIDFMRFVSRDNKSYRDFINFVLLINGLLVIAMSFVEGVKLQMESKSIFKDGNNGQPFRPSYR